MRIAHYVPSTHWDREWYEPFQGFRMRLVSMVDEVLEMFDTDPGFTSFDMDGQVIPVYDYLEIRPENRENIAGYVQEGRLKLGPWYVLPDEWLVSGESLVRNLQFGIECAESFGAPSSRAGFVCDMFGHTGQLPQIFDQMGLPAAFVWRGTHESELHGHFNWKAPDGSMIPAYRFGRIGYCSYAIDVRGIRKSTPFNIGDAVDRLVTFVSTEAQRSKINPILLFDGADHLEIEPKTSELLARANEALEPQGIRIEHSTLDNYIDELLEERSKIEKTVIGELREPGRDPVAVDEQWLIPGVLSSRIHLKQKNAECEDELCQWTEPFSSFAAEYGHGYPDGYLRTAWKHLFENHPHDSICGCSIDQVHQDMLYRFDQSIGISSRLTVQALKAIAVCTVSEGLPDGSIMLALFNATAIPIDEPVDFDIPLPENWPNRFHEFFGYEEKFAFRLKSAHGDDITYQLVGQRCDSKGFRRERYSFPVADNRHRISVTAALKVPAYGYTTIMVEPVDGPVRYPGSMAVSHREIENDVLHVRAEMNGTLTVTDKRTGKLYEQLLTFEDCADIGDGWYHGIAVNDRINLSSGCAADVAVIADGIGKTTLHITYAMNVPYRFDFRKMERCVRTVPLTIVSDVTLREGSDRIEVTTTVDNTVLDHRLRVLFPTNCDGETYMSDSAFDAVERPVALKEGNDVRRELDVETRPQVSWTAFGDGVGGLAVVSRGLPETAVIDRKDRPVALTLFRAFRHAVLANDNPGGQIQGRHTFRYDIVPIDGEIPIKRLFLLGQRVNGPVRVIDIIPDDIKQQRRDVTLPKEHSFLSVDGNAVITSVQRKDNCTHVRLFNPYDATESIRLRFAAGSGSAKCVALDGSDDTKASVMSHDDVTEVIISPKRITTVVFNTDNS